MRIRFVRASAAVVGVCAITTSEMHITSIRQAGELIKSAEARALEQWHRSAGADRKAHPEGVARRPHNTLSPLRPLLAGYACFAGAAERGRWRPPSAPLALGQTAYCGGLPSTM
jgi:hypothetical protein